MTLTEASVDRTERLMWRVVSYVADQEKVFSDHFAGAAHAFWLDTALHTDFARFSYMGDATGPHAEIVTYTVQPRRLTVERNGFVTVRDESVFTYLDRALRRRALTTPELPFDFNLGYVGYLGYELKADCGAAAAHRSTSPDAMLILADRLVVFDHQEQVAYLLVQDDDTGRAAAWLDKMERSLAVTADQPAQAALGRLDWLKSRAAQEPPVSLTARHSRQRYLDLIGDAQREIRHGESYEVCLTNKMTARTTIAPLSTYRLLRQSNPAPYAAYLRFPNLHVLGSSPERFVTVRPDRTVESKPIKGTRKRGATPAEDATLKHDLATAEKDRAENLMIVDLLRNDLGTVCEIGTVHVPHLFAVESYATVHQLVSTVRGRLRDDVSAVECVRRAFPGGSMTGAPKLRTMEIIDRLEAGPRGVYSGAIGFFGLNGSADLNIVIRTITATPTEVSFGVGGAIISLSDPDEEYAETLLKAKALIAAISAGSVAASLALSEKTATTQDILTDDFSTPGLAAE